jgi:hypothetical protein
LVEGQAVHGQLRTVGTDDPGIPHLQALQVYQDHPEAAIDVHAQAIAQETAHPFVPNDVAPLDIPDVNDLPAAQHVDIAIAIPHQQGAHRLVPCKAGDVHIAEGVHLGDPFHLATGRVHTEHGVARGAPGFARTLHHGNGLEVGKVVAPLADGCLRASIDAPAKGRGQQE